jgi:hypothetical protein
MSRTETSRERAARDGFEPPFLGPEPSVLPLDDRALTTGKLPSEAIQIDGDLTDGGEIAVGVGDLVFDG